MKNILILILALSAFSPAAFSKDSWENLSASDFSINLPPKPGDAQDLADLQEILRLQATRTSGQCQAIADMGHADFKDLFKNSGLLNESEYDDVKTLMTKTADLAHSISDSFKDRFRRPRPATEDSRIHPCDSGDVRSNDYSYPSSHTLVATTIGCVLATVYPDRADAFNGYRAIIGHMRVLGGMHHPTDIQAGETLGQDLCQRLLGNDDYRDELKAF